MEANRWWEFYFIRYFVGSVLGSLVVTALAFHPDSAISGVISELLNADKSNLLELKSDHFLVILSFGIAFCYIASSPILVMHALRAHFDFQANINTDINAWLLRLALALVPLSTLFYFLQDQLAKFLFLAAYTLIISFQIAFLAPALRQKFDGIFQFYKALAKDRAKISESRKEYIQSYKHLREHGNAFLILFCELILGCALFVSSTLAEALIIIIAWIAPTVPIWFLGTFLESKLTNT